MSGLVIVESLKVMEVNEGSTFYKQYKTMCLYVGGLACGKYLSIFLLIKFTHDHTQKEEKKELHLRLYRL